MPRFITVYRSISWHPEFCQMDFRVSLRGFILPLDCIDRADFIARSAFDAGVQVNYINRISRADGPNRTYRLAGAAGNAVFCNEMSTHEFLLFAYLESCYINLPSFRIISSCLWIIFRTLDMNRRGIASGFLHLMSPCVLVFMHMLLMAHHCRGKTACPLCPPTVHVSTLQNTLNFLMKLDK